MAIASGIDGKVSIGATTILNIEEWSLDIKHNVRTNVFFGSSWESKLKGARGASGSLKGIYNAGDTTGQAVLQTAALTGVGVALRLYYDTTNYYTIANCFISGLKVSNKANGDVEIEFNFEVDGAVA